MIFFSEQGLGMTEAGVLCVTPKSNGKGGSVGVLVPGTEVKVIDTKGMETVSNPVWRIVFQRTPGYERY